VDADPLPFHPPSLPRLPLLLHPSHPFLSLLLFPSSRKFSKEVWGSTTVSFPQCPAKRKQPVAKVGGDQIHLVPKVGGDASHGSHIAVAPIVTGLLQIIMQRTDIRPLLDAFPLRTRSAYVSAVLSDDTCYRSSGRLGRCIWRALVPWPTRVYPPNPKRHLGRFSRFCTTRMHAQHRPRYVRHGPAMRPGKNGTHRQTDIIPLFYAF